MIFFLTKSWKNIHPCLDVLHALQLLIVLLIVTVIRDLDTSKYLTTLLLLQMLKRSQHNLGLISRPDNLHPAEECPGGRLQVAAEVAAEVLQVLDLSHEHEAVTAGLVARHLGAGDVSETTDNTLTDRELSPYFILYKLFSPPSTDQAAVSILTSH